MRCWRVFARPVCLPVRFGESVICESRSTELFRGAVFHFIVSGRDRDGFDRK